MSLGWNVLESLNLPPQQIMDKDKALLYELNEKSPVTLHLYDFDRPSLTLGCFIEPHKYLDFVALKKWGLEVARRPTGGGIIFHLTDLTYSVLIPAHNSLLSTNILENYKLVHDVVSSAIQEFKPTISCIDLLEPSNDSVHLPFCMANPTVYDLMIGNRKVGGAAQRFVRKYGLLHQGSLSLRLPSEMLLKEVLLEHASIVPKMQRYSYPLIEDTCLNFLIKRLQLKEHLKKAFQAKFE